mgnify:FL=1
MIKQQRKLTRKKRVPFIIFSFFILVFLYLAWSFYIPLSWSEKEIKEIDISPKLNSRQIGQNLESVQIIKSSAFFYFAVRVLNLDRKLRFGLYLMSPSYSLSRILNILTGKETGLVLKKVTIPEGYTKKEIAQVLAEAYDIDKKAFLQFNVSKAKQVFKDKYFFLDLIPTENLEGYLFPETYIFVKNEKIEKIYEAFFGQFEKNIVTLWQQKEPKTSKYNLHQVLTLASMVEKEAYKLAEMPIIAGVFYNRLAKRIVLASCPTVAYALGEPRKKVLTYDDVEVKSPYNTYRRQGLPPTPIASPGIKAFKAALEPAKTNYLYFVSNRDGTSNFSTSLREHTNKRNFLNNKYR